MLLNLRKRVSKIRVFDPACGSGNFLVIAYKEMRAIEAEINRRRGEPDRRTEIPLTNFRGIELRDFPAARGAICALALAQAAAQDHRFGKVKLGQFEAQPNQAVAQPASLIRFLDALALAPLFCERERRVLQHLHAGRSLRDLHILKMVAAGANVKGRSGGALRTAVSDRKARGRGDEKRRSRPKPRVLSPIRESGFESPDAGWATAPQHHRASKPIP
jgi:hypothetical protein